MREHQKLLQSKKKMKGKYKMSKNRDKKKKGQNHTTEMISHQTAIPHLYMNQRNKKSMIQAKARSLTSTKTS